MIDISSRSRSSCRSVLSMISVASAFPSEGRVAVPAKMTSSIFGVRSDLADWLPKTQERASTRLDLPDPLGPTTDGHTRSEFETNSIGERFETCEFQ